VRGGRPGSTWSFASRWRSWQILSLPFLAPRPVCDAERPVWTSRIALGSGRSTKPVSDGSDPVDGPGMRNRRRPGLGPCCRGATRRTLNTRHARKVGPADEQFCHRLECPRTAMVEGRDPLRSGHAVMGCCRARVGLLLMTIIPRAVRPGVRRRDDGVGFAVHFVCTRPAGRFSRRAPSGSRCRTPRASWRPRH